MTRRTKLFAALSALFGTAFLLRRLAARSNTQVHRINHHQPSTSRSSTS
ncbi:hypothetical protein [Pseudonocardia spinosispora]|nr:hypothetical protein [Pseudonocardia spinosispora]